MSATVFASAFVALYVGHEIGDHWVQTDAQACGKGRPGKTGRLLCARHVLSLTAVKAAALALTAVVTGLHLHLLWVVAVLGLDAVTHYWADRRFTLRRLAHRVGKGDFAGLGDPLTAPTGTGAYALDQSWHIAWLFITALLASLGATA